MAAHIHGRGSHGYAIPNSVITWVEIPSVSTEFCTLGCCLDSGIISDDQVLVYGTHSRQTYLLCM